jgi:hypothetical protein
VVEADHHQPSAAHLLASAVATTGAHVSVQVGDRLGDPCMVSAHHRSVDALIAERVQHAHILDRPQHQIPRGHRVLAVGAAEQLAGVGVAPLEDPLEPFGGRGAFLAERRGAGAVPAARGLAVAAQVLFAVVGDLADVVVLPAHCELGQIRDHPSPRSAATLGSKRTRGALLSCVGFGWYEGRAMRQRKGERLRVRLVRKC